MKKYILLVFIIVSANVFAQEGNDDYLQDELNFENPYITHNSIQEQEELNYQYSEPSEYFLTEEEIYNTEIEYDD